REITVVDELFAGVMDFSDAERLGFIKAFITFWTQRPGNTRTRQELQVSAEHLLRGCREHYRAGVTRVSRMSAAVPPHMAEEFKARALSLLDLADSDEFRAQAKLIVQDFPKLKPWMEWWRRPSHSPMLFESERKMDIELWNSIPATTNAEESMHWKLYSACGRDHLFIEGMYSLYKFCFHYERLYEAAIKGQPIRYGTAEPWKVLAEKLGTTKPSRADNPENKKRKKNDGRPPDTVKELMKDKKNMVKKKKDAPVIDKIILGPPAYQWKGNSCYMDTTLQFLYLGLSNFFDQLSPLFTSLPSDSGFHQLYSHLELRATLNPDEPNITKNLAMQRDSLRAMLVEKKIIKKMNSFESLLVWFTSLILEDDSKTSYRPIGLFELLFSEVRMCSGSEKTGGRHIELPNPPIRRRLHQISPSDHEDFMGSFSDYFADMLSIEKTPTSARSCWRTREGVPICSGTRKDYRSLVTSIPIFYSVEIGTDDGASTIWNFPETLLPDTPAAAKHSGIIYDLLGYALINENRNHWIARFASDDKKRIFTYDGTKHDGFAVEEPNATFSTHMIGAELNLPKGYSVYQAFYILRGGVKAQDIFYKSRKQALSKRFSIHIPNKGLEKLPTVSYKATGFVQMKSKDA
ncbi:hypothetical protein BJ912DRAFT_859605, partial [Pholiota molesta]